MTDFDVRLNWYRSLIDRDTLKKLTTKNNWRPLLQNLGMLGFSAATGIFAFWAFHNLAWPWVVLSGFFHCTFYGFFGGGAGGHELSHSNMFRSKWLNEFFIRLNGFLTWFNFVHFRHSHANHHQYTVHQELDLEVMLPINIKWYQWIWGFTISVPGIRRLFPMMLRHTFGQKREFILYLEKDRLFFPPKDASAVKEMQRWSRVMLLGHFLLGILFVASGNWILLVLVTFAPFITPWFVMVTHMPQHIGMRPDVPDWRLSTRTYTADPITRFFYWNMNYHVEHHMFAAVPFYHLPKLRKVIEGDLPKASEGLIATWREMYGAIRRQRTEPEYYLTPELPKSAGAYKIA